MDTFSPRIYVSGVADDQTFHDVIEGYPQRLSATAGEDVDLCVSTTAASYDGHRRNTTPGQSGLIDLPATGVLGRTVD